MINAWQWEKSKAIALPACKCKSQLNFRVRGQFEINILKVLLMNTTYFIFMTAIIWKVSTCQRIPGSIPEPSIRWGDAGQQKHYFDSCQLITTWMYNIRLQAPKLATKCNIRHWYACGADGRKVGWSVYGQVIAEFSRMDKSTLSPGSSRFPIWESEKTLETRLWIDFLSHGASHWAHDQIKISELTCEKKKNCLIAGYIKAKL